MSSMKTGGKYCTLRKEKAQKVLVTTEWLSNHSTLNIKQAGAKNIQTLVISKAGQHNWHGFSFHVKISQGYIEIQGNFQILRGIRAE